MSGLRRWFPRLAAAVTGAVFTLVVPAYAWAAGSGATEAVRYRRRGGFFPLGFVGGLCCLFVVAAVVLVAVLIRRGRGRPPR